MKHTLINLATGMAVIAGDILTNTKGEEMVVADDIGTPPNSKEPYGKIHMQLADSNQPISMGDGTIIMSQDYLQQYSHMPQSWDCEWQVAE